MGFGQGSGSEGKPLINLDEIDLVPSIVELVDRLPQLATSEPSDPLCLSEGRTASG